MKLKHLSAEQKAQLKQMMLDAGTAQIAYELATLCRERPTTSSDARAFWDKKASILECAGDDILNWD